MPIPDGQERPFAPPGTRPLRKSATEAAITEIAWSSEAEAREAAQLAAPGLSADNDFANAQAKTQQRSG